MHRDIVPRAFACDYSLVADLLARVGDGFREHGCLQNPNGRQVGAHAVAIQSFLEAPVSTRQRCQEPCKPLRELCRTSSARQRVLIRHGMWLDNDKRDASTIQANISSSACRVS